MRKLLITAILRSKAVVVYLRDIYIYIHPYVHIEQTYMYVYVYTIIIIYIHDVGCINVLYDIC
jgi:hypothetical protein